MIIAEHEKINLLKTFPRIKLSYETLVHNKVCEYNICMIIPKGERYFAWITMYKQMQCCILLKISEKNQISDIQIHKILYNKELTGTVFYGTFFTFQKKNIFCFENIYYYKNKNISNLSYLDKLGIFCNIFKNELIKGQLIFKLPLMNTNFDNLWKLAAQVPYEIKYIRYINGIQVYNLYYNIIKKQNNLMQNIGKTNEYATFTIKPDIQNDVYYVLDKQHNVIDYACIPDYKTSVMMNKLFRNIKENNNLDALEESDDDEEFENNNIDKFVYLDKKYDMQCKYHYKYKKWIPVNIIY